MIQRIQSIFLLIATIAVGLMLIFPIAGMENVSGASYIFKFNGLFELSNGQEKLFASTIPLMVLLILNLVLSVSAIFLYKKRVLQMRLCIINSILLLLSMGVIAYYVAISFSKIQANVNYTVFALMPVIAIILSIMAYYSINKDEKLVKSIDRIR